MLLILGRATLIGKATYVTVALAQEKLPVWQKEFEDTENVSIKSNVITWNRTKEFKGKSRQDIRDFFQNF